MSTTSDLALLRRKLAAADYSPDAYVKEIATRCVGGHELHLQRKNIQVTGSQRLSYVQTKIIIYIKITGCLKTEFHDIHALYRRCLKTPTLS